MLVVLVSSFHFWSSFCCSSSFVVFLHFFSTSSLTLPWTVAGFLTPILCFQPSPLQSDLQHFRFQPFHSLLAARATVLPVGIFYPQAFLALRSFTDILTCAYQGFPGGRQFSLEVCRALYWSWEHRPCPSACWFSVIHIHFLILPYIMMNCLWWKINLSAPYSFRTLFACTKSYVKTIKKHF